MVLCVSPNNHLVEYDSVNTLLASHRSMLDDHRSRTAADRVFACQTDMLAFLLHIPTESGLAIARIVADSCLERIEGRPGRAQDRRREFSFVRWTMNGDLRDEDAVRRCCGNAAVATLRRWADVGLGRPVVGF